MIKAICFDLDGVYFIADSFPKFINEIKNLTTKNDQVEFVLKGEMMQKFKKNEVSETEYWDYVRKELEISTPNEVIFELLRNSYEVNPEVIEYINKVKAAGYATCICSNNVTTWVRELNNKFDFLKDFDVDVLSYEVGDLKPNRKIFEELVKKANCNADEIVFSDDKETAVKGAKEVGINAFLFTDFSSFVQELEKLGVRA